MKKFRKNVIELTKNYEQFIKGKEINKKGKQIFNKTIKKAANTKQRGSK